jgi:hypothetical protein
MIHCMTLAFQNCSKYLNGNSRSNLIIAVDTVLNHEMQALILGVALGQVESPPMIEAIGGIRMGLIRCCGLCGRRVAGGLSVCG